MMLKLGKKISVENQSVLSIYIELGYRYHTVMYSCQTFIVPLYEHLLFLMVLDMQFILHIVTLTCSSKFYLNKDF